tara:strand:- start:864 stop:1268 length:405 start_codon:yes stop_codon:yes gene_type:complete
MMKHYIAYDSEGRIHRSGICAKSDLKLQAGTDLSVLVVDDRVDDSKFYVVDGAIVEKGTIVATLDKETIYADGVDEAVLSPLPVPVTVWIDGEDVLVEDGSFELSVNTVGPYHIVVDDVRYPRMVWSVNAVEVL